MESVVLYSNMVAQMSLCGWGDSGSDAAEHSLKVYGDCFAASGRNRKSSRILVSKFCMDCLAFPYIKKEMLV